LNFSNKKNITERTNEKKHIAHTDTNIHLKIHVGIKIQDNAKHAKQYGPPIIDTKKETYVEAYRILRDPFRWTVQV
jgi:hypothetical protein